jgi:hypothetical protein
MRESFEDAMVAGFVITGINGSYHPKDRYVLAAAIVGRANVLVTNNLSDFPASALDPYDVDVQPPDAFLCNQWELDEESMAAVIENWPRDFLNPPLTLEQLLQTFEKHTPQFCEIVRTSGLTQ